MDGVDRQQPLRLELVGQVAGLQVIIGEGAGKRAPEGVAAFPGDDVGADAAHLALRTEPTGFETDFLNRPVVGGDGGVLTAPALAVVVHHAVVQQLLLAGASAVDRQLR